ncbi:MAG: acyl-CoA thioesterase [Nevskiales bacterium]
MPWDIPPSFSFAVTVESADVDGLDHCNNVSYLRWLEQAAWQHSIELGLDLEAYKRLDRAMVVRRHELDYLGAAYLDDELIVGTWLHENDGKLSLWRKYQIIRPRDSMVLIRATTHFVCAELSSGKPKRQPEEFLKAYASLSSRGTK